MTQKINVFRKKTMHLILFLLTAISTSFFGVKSIDSFNAYELSETDFSDLLVGKVHAETPGDYGGDSDDHHDDPGSPNSYSP